MLDFLKRDKHWIEYPFGTLFYGALVRSLKNVNIHPNWYTMGFIIMGITSGVLLANNYIILAFIAWRMSIILDLVDGPIARFKNLTSKLGEYLDNIGHVISVLALVVGGCYGSFEGREGHFAALAVSCMVLLVYTLKYIDYAVVTERSKFRITNKGNLLFLEKRLSDFLDIEIVFLFFLNPLTGVLIFLGAKALRAVALIYKSIKKVNNL